MAAKKTPVASIPAALQIDAMDVPDIAKGRTARDPRIVTAQLGRHPVKSPAAATIAAAILRQTPTR